MVPRHTTGLQCLLTINKETIKTRLGFLGRCFSLYTKIGSLLPMLHSHRLIQHVNGTNKQTNNKLYIP